MVPNYDATQRPQPRLRCPSHSDDEERFYIVVEIKSSQFLNDLRIMESVRIFCGKAHFATLKMKESPVRSEVAIGINQLLATIYAKRSVPASPAYDT